ncbi:MAG: efflux RND transporter permease subunit [Methylococcales bacterium]|nr:efflux RND transporter permease subunit [Methylococcales bacterium]
MSSKQKSQPLGAISWMAAHSIAPNLIMFACIIGGLMFLQTMKQEVFPDFELDKVSIKVIYPGASPEEIESGLLLSIEDAISGLDGIDEIRSTATEGLAMVVVDALAGSDIQRLVQEVEKEVDRITTFPEDAEVPQVSIISEKQQVLTMVLYGDTNEKVLHQLGEDFRKQLLQSKEITQVELSGVRPLEISIEVSQENLRRYKISLATISQRIKEASLDLPGGSVKTQAGEILIRMKERKDYQQQFARLPIIITADGSEVLLEDIAVIKDGYQETDYSATYNGKPAIMLLAFSVGNQTPISVSDAVKAKIKTSKQSLPAGIHAEIRFDMSEIYAQRVDLLLRNSAMGLLLVFFTLALFLELRLAFWVMMGIPIAFLGSFLVLPLLGVTINMISLLAFIIALGIVVDDAIIIGENIYHHRQNGLPPLEAAIKGARDMAQPVTFSILTNIATFMPLFFIPGLIGKMFFMIPLVVVTVFLLSLAESLLILPNHLGHLKPLKRTGFQRWLFDNQQKFSDAFKEWTIHRYGGALEGILKHRYLTTIIAFSLLVAVLSYAASGRMGMSLFPKTESNFSQATITLPYGTPIEKTQAAVKILTQHARQVIKDVPDGDQLIKGIFSQIGKNGTHVASIKVYLAAPEIRERIMGTDEFSRRWRKLTGELVGVDSLLFESNAGGPGAGAALTIELNHQDMAILEKASKKLADAIRSYPITKDIDDGFSLGKPQLDFKLLPEGLSLGFSAQNVARQIRNAFYGSEVARQQRGRNEIKIMVRLPKNERILEQNITDLLLWTDSGKEIPLTEVVKIERGRAYTEINRRNGQRNVQVKAGVSPKTKTGDVINSLKATDLPELLKQFPGLNYSFQGEQAEMTDSLGSLKLSFVIAVIIIYAMLAIPFQSYILPFIVIISIPFGIIGAIFGHLIMSYDLSVLSLLGVVALSGIVVNDSLVLIDSANQMRAKTQKPAFEVIKMAAIQRFRPIILTTMTTFLGLFPMILETSRQAKILIPMAISIGFGILFATFITLVLLPSLYLIIDDIAVLWKRIKSND